MYLAQIPLSEDPHVVVDWIEILTVAAPFKETPIPAIQRMWDTRKNTEDTSPDGKDSGYDNENSDEVFIESIYQEIRDRQKFLGDAYPFFFSDSGETLLLAPDQTVGRTVYLFCLFLSNADNDCIFDSGNIPYVLDYKVRDWFQACSTWAAAGVTKGSAYTFGFPRPDGSGFLDKLRQIYLAFGEGEVVTAPRPGVSTNPKDEGIDVIAWSHRLDGAPGKQYILGQIASGRNWRDKSVTEFVKPLHSNWFSRVPASDHTAAIFIPFCIEKINGATSLAEQLHILTPKFGHIYYRYVLPKYACEGFNADSSSGTYVDRKEDIQHISNWVLQTIKILSVAA
jgi:hypothetical protein